MVFIVKKVTPAWLFADVILSVRNFLPTENSRSKYPCWYIFNQVKVCSSLWTPIFDIESFFRKIVLQIFFVIYVLYNLVCLCNAILQITSDITQVEWPEPWSSYFVSFPRTKKKCMSNLLLVCVWNLVPINARCKTKPLQSWEIL